MTEYGDWAIDDMAEVGNGPHKVALCGKADVGKTSIFYRVWDDTFVEHRPKSQGIQYCEVSVEDSDGKSVQIHLYDTLDMERYGSLTRTHYVDSKIILLVYDCDDMESLELLKDVYDDAVTHVPEATMVLVRNKVDKQYQTVEEEEAVRILCIGDRGQQKRKLACHMATSAMTGAGILELCTELGNLLYNRQPVAGINRGFNLEEFGNLSPQRPEDPQSSPSKPCC